MQEAMIVRASCSCMLMQWIRTGARVSHVFSCHTPCPGPYLPPVPSNRFTCPSTPSIRYRSSDARKKNHKTLHLDTETPPHADALDRHPLSERSGLRRSVSRQHAYLPQHPPCSSPTKKGQPQAVPKSNYSLISTAQQNDAILNVHVRYDPKS